MLTQRPKNSMRFAACLLSAFSVFPLLCAMKTRAHGGQTASLDWKPLYEPGSGGWMTGMRISPHDSKRILLSGDMLGVGLSTDGGRSWQAT